MLMRTLTMSRAMVLAALLGAAAPAFAPPGPASADGSSGTATTAAATAERVCHAGAYISALASSRFVSGAP